MKLSLIPQLTATALFVLCTTSQATERRFAFSYETTTAPKGTLEYEQHFLWEKGAGFDTFGFRQEVEFGITDRFQLGVYLFDFEHAREAGANETKWTGSGIEAVYQMTDPNKDSFGSALYGEVIVNDNELELEGKILLQKNFGPFMLVYNGIVEAKWEDEYSEEVGVLEQTLGLSYQVNPSFSVGLEAKHEVEFENWEHSGGNAVFVGPNLAYRKGKFFAAVTCLLRVSDVIGEPHIELGTVMGVHF